MNLAPFAGQAACWALKQSNQCSSLLRRLTCASAFCFRQSKVLPSTVNDMESEKLEEKLTQRLGEGQRSIFLHPNCRKKRRVHPPDADLLDATKLVVEQGKRLAHVLHLYPGIPKSTLGDTVKRARANKNILPPVGSPPKISHNDNQQLFEWCLESAKRALHQTKQSILNAAMRMANKRGVKFGTDSGLPSQSWWLRFCAQFPQMKLFRAQLLSRGQAHAANALTLNRFYQLLSNVIIQVGVGVGQIWAADETVMYKVPRCSLA